MTPCNDDSEVIPGVRIAGEAFGGDSAVEVVCPTTGQKLASVHGGGSAEVARAVGVAHGVLDAWHALAGAERAKALRAVAESLRSERDDRLAMLITRESGKRFAEARGEVAFSAHYFDWFADVAETQGEGVLDTPGRSFVIRRRPLGVVGVITPWNFPASIPARKLAAALAAGCTTVFKPSEFTPLSGLRFAEILEEHLPVGACNTVVGDGEVVSNALADHPEVAAVTFTGSTRVGTLIAVRCAATLTRATLELGGKAPFVVCEDADVAEAVDALMVAKYRNNGASCIAANNVFVHRDVYIPFVEAYRQRSLALVVGDPMDDQVELGPMVTPAHVVRLAGLLDDARANGAVIAQAAPVTRQGSFFAPAVVEVPDGCRMWDEEIFGPVTAIRAYDDQAAVIAEINSWPFGLGGYVCSADSGHAADLAAQLAIGIVGVNNGAPNTPEVPFGGFKRSGIGSEGGVQGADEFIGWQTVSTAADPERSSGSARGRRQ